MLVTIWWIPYTNHRYQWSDRWWQGSGPWLWLWITASVAAVARCVVETYRRSWHLWQSFVLAETSLRMLLPAHFLSVSRH